MKAEVGKYKFGAHEPFMMVLKKVPSQHKDGTQLI